MLKVKNLQKSFHNDIVLDGINMEVKSGEVIAVMGSSGCGKSTLLRCINRLIEPDAGEIFLENKALHKLNQSEMETVRSNIGFVFQHFNLVKRLTVKQNVALGLIKSGYNLQEAYDKAMIALANVNMCELAEESVGNISGGEQQRVGIARALAIKPDLILLDEPTASLDPILIMDILKILEDIARERKNTSMIVVTHEVNFARRVADRIFFMDKGKIIESGSPQKIFTDPSSWIGKKYIDIINYH